MHKTEIIQFIFIYALFRYFRKWLLCLIIFCIILKVCTQYTSKVWHQVILLLKQLYKNVSENLIMVDVPSSNARKTKLNVNQEINLYFSKEDIRVYPV